MTDPWTEVRQTQAPGSPPQRKKLQLKPRSARAVADNVGSPRSSGKSNPFGAAKPREEVLASKGIDVSTIDSRIDKKAHIAHFTKGQEEQIEILRAELTKVEADLRNANEMELPEEMFRTQADAKRKELNDLMAKFTKENEERGGGTQQDSSTTTSTTRGSGSGHFGGSGDGGPGGRKYERPSERRRRLDQQRGHRNGHHHHDDDESGSGAFGNRHFRSHNGYNDREGGRF